MSLLQVDKLVRHFGGVRAVDGVSFALPAGSFAALIGPNGAGKSTLFALIAGQLEPGAGTVRFAGRALAGLTAAARVRLGLARTFQTAQAFASMTVAENVQLALAARDGLLRAGWRPPWRRDRSAAAALLADVGLAARAPDAAVDLPYGDLKRLELAIALAGRPQLLLMDEPTAGMAPAERIALMDLVHALAARSGMTVLFTEHSMDVVFAYAKRVLVLARGQLIADGAPDAVRRDPAAQSAYFGAGA